MTDEKKKLPEDFADVDWDKALSEWDTGSFSPEVAKDFWDTFRMQVRSDVFGTLPLVSRHK